MTTETSQPSEIDAGELYRSLGRLEEAQSQFREQLARHEEQNERQLARHQEQNERQFARHEEHNDRQFARLEARLDRLMFGMFGFGATIIAAVVASIVITLLGG
jgi:ribosomal protein S4